MESRERELIERLVPAVTRNAAVVNIDETSDQYRVTIAGTTGVVAHCEVPRTLVTDAERQDDERSRLASMLKQCADRTVAEIADGRG